MIEVTYVLNDFSKILKKEFEENNEIVVFFKTKTIVKMKLNEIKDIEKDIDNVEEMKKSFDEEITSLKKSKEKVMDDIDNVKKSKNYLENIKKIENIELIKKEIENNIYELKQMIDFKKLSDVFHGDDKKWSMIKDYRSNFSFEFQKNDELGILNLLDEVKIDKGKILIKIKEIKDKKDKLYEEKIEKDETQEIISELKGIEAKIKRAEDEKIIELKKEDMFKINKEEEINKLKEELTKINVILIASVGQSGTPAVSKS